MVRLEPSPQCLIARRQVVKQFAGGSAKSRLLEGLMTLEEII